MLLWGKPELRLYCNSPVATWPERQIWAILRRAQDRGIGYFTPVISVSFTLGEAPFWEQLLVNQVLETCGGIKTASFAAYSSRQ
jgi:hypothetical protein